MESPSRGLSMASLPNTSSPRHRSTTTTTTTSTSDFEFWNLGRNPSPTTLHSADELFSDGFLLPLHLLSLNHPDPELEPDPSPPAFSASITSTTTTAILTASKRWKDIFKRRDNDELDKNNDTLKSHKTDNDNNNKKKREKKNTSKNTPAELNINIWPFSRSRSAGNNTGRPKQGSSPSGRKVSSAPCSRSNSSGSRRSLPNSPARPGVHLGRTSPVWNVRRTRPGSDEVRRHGKGRVLSLNVPKCIAGYRQQLTCRSEENVGGSDGGTDGGGVAKGGNNGNLFGLRGLFSKKSVVTV